MVFKKTGKEKGLRGGLAGHDKTMFTLLILAVSLIMVLSGRQAANHRASGFLAKRIIVMLNPNIFTQAAFATYVKGLLVAHSIDFVDEEETVTTFAVGGNAEELAEMAFDVETSHLTISDESGVLGGMSFVNEYCQRRKAPITELYNYSVAIEHLAPKYEEDEE